MRAALYARFSSAELQDPKSLADQLHDARRHAARLGASVVAEFSDAGISAVTMSQRPGLLDLLAAAKAKAFDLVIADELSRLTRDGGHAWDLFHELAALGIAIDTPAEGRIDELRIGFGGTMGAIERKNIAHRVRRGLGGVVRDGRFPSRAPYGYRRRIEHRPDGELIRGLLRIHEPEAEIVRRVAAELVAGATARQVALRLNAEGVPSPGGRGWTVTHIAPGGKAGGLARNPLYAGELVWNRTTQPKDRATGKARKRSNPAADLVRHPVPDLAIVEAATWSALQAELDRRAGKARAAGNASAANAPKRLLSGLITCGLCGSAMHTTGPGARYRCLGRTRKGPTYCDNATGADPALVEAQALAQLRAELLHPEVVEDAVRTLREAATAKSRAGRDRRGKAEAELGEATRQAARLVDQVAEGVLSGQAVTAKLAELEARRVRLEAELAQIAASADVVELHPRAAARYRQLVEDLAARLTPAPGDPASHDAARQALRQVISGVRVYPDERAVAGAKRRNTPGGWTLQVDGDLLSLFSSDSSAAARFKAAR